MDKDNVKKILNKFAHDVVKESKRNLLRDGKNASKKLYHSLDYHVEATKNSIQLDFVGMDYAMYQDQGVKGKDPNAMPQGAKVRTQQAPNSPFRFGTNSGPKGGLRSAISKWINKRRMRLRDDEGRFVAGGHETLTYLITRKIYLTGIAPSYFLTKPFEKHFKKLPSKIVEAYSIDIQNYLLKTFNQNK